MAASIVYFVFIVSALPQYYCFCLLELFFTGSPILIPDMIYPTQCYWWISVKALEIWLGPYNDMRCYYYYCIHLQLLSLLLFGCRSRDLWNLLGNARRAKQASKQASAAAAAAVVAIP